MGTLYVLMSIISLILVVSAWLWTRIMPPTIPFGVRIPPDRVDAPIIAHVRRDYHTGLIVIALLVGAASWFFAQYNSVIYTSVVGILVTTILIYLDYYSAHKRIAHVKEREGWYNGLRQVVMAEVGTTRSEVSRPSLLWLLPALLILAAIIAIGIVRYPALPAMIPTHFGADGQPNQWTDKAVALWTLPLPVILVSGLLYTLAYYLPHTRQQIDPNNPEADHERQRLLRQGTSKLLLMIATMTNLIFLLTALLVLGVLPPGNAVTIVPIVTTITLLILVGTITYLTRLMSRASQSQHAQVNANKQFVARDDDRYWIGGILYYNPEDPALWVEKRMGMGMTINFGNPTGKIITVAFIVIILISSLLPIILGH
ncbi:membrane protein [Dictyobacter sp. S3.2.2.5]|uniref:Membrane protein n=2 Tax=Dictyobacter halimunensis TaxID=3026934 RepID=A0ABQ6FSI2_9CHLR|nr:membrane protein [Dictyobacter sp. S3.2.2.5]